MRENSEGQTDLDWFCKFQLLFCLRGGVCLIRGHPGQPKGKLRGPAQLSSWAPAQLSSWAICWVAASLGSSITLTAGRTVLSAHALGDLCCSECGSRPPLPALPPLRPLRLHSFNLTLASGTYLWVLPCSVNSKFSPRTTLCFATNNNNKSNNS